MNRLAVVVALTAMGLAGCAAARQKRAVAHVEARSPGEIVQVAHTTVGNSPEGATTPPSDKRLLAAGVEVPPPAVDDDAARAGGMTLAELETLALENHPVAEEASARIEAANGRWEQAGLKPNPSIGYHATQIGNRDTTGQQGAYLSQRFITAGKLRLDQSVASWEVQESRNRLDETQLRIVNNVRLRFYEALVARQRLNLTAELVRVGDAFAVSSRKLLKAQQTSENDVLQAEIEAEAARIEADNARNQYVEAFQRLAAAVGRDQLPVANLIGDLDGELPEISPDGSLSAILGQSPELEAARSRVVRSRFAIQRAEREWIPNVDAFVSARHNTINPKHDNVVNVQLGIPLPIFDRNQGNIRQARADWVAAENAVRRIELDLRDRFAVAYRRYANARQQVDRYSERILPRARKSLELVKTGYEKRQVNYLTLLTTQRTYFRTSLARLDAVWALRRSVIAIEGQLLTDE